MTKNWIAINMVLLITAGLLAWQLNIGTRRFNDENKLSKVQPVRDLKQNLSGDAGLPVPRSAQPLNPAEFSVIAANNLFAESRTKDEKVETAAAVPETPPLQVKPILVGITIAGSMRYVAIIDPTAGGNVRKVQTKRLGDSFAGYMITDITGDRMVLENGARREIIPLHDASKAPAKGAKTPILPTRVVSFGAGGPSSGTGITQQALLPPNAAPPRTPTSGAPVSASIGSGNVSGPPGQSGITRVSPQQGRQVPGSAQQTPPNWNERTDDQGRRVIRTPFGDVIQDKPPNP